MGKKGHRYRLGKKQVETLVADAIVDAYTEDEQRMGFFTLIEDELAMPFKTKVLGVEVDVQRVELNSADEIVAVCRRGSHRQTVSSPSDMNGIRLKAGAATYVARAGRFVTAYLALDCDDSCAAAF